MTTDTPRTASDVLRAAREKIEKPENWTTGAMARGKTRRPCLPLSKAARCWCSMGAIEVAAGGSDEGAYARDILRKATGAHTIGKWNDEHDHADILNGFDRAIQLADSADKGEVV